MNPLLDPASLPAFDTIGAEQVEPGVRELLRELTVELDRLEAAPEPTWQGLIEPLERISDRLDVVWGRVGHLLGVRNSEALRAAHSVVQPEVVACSLRLSQSRPLYRALGRLRERGDELDLDAAQRRVVDLLLRDAELAGVALEGERRARFTAIEKELAELATTYSNHVLDATRAFALVLRRPEEIEGLPASLLELAAQAAREAGESDASAGSGPWRITLAPPSYRPFMEHGVRRDLREQLFRAQLTRASEGAGSNAPLLSRILGLRQEQARLLERPTYADLSLASKSAPDVAGVRRLLEELRREALPAARRELEELREFARGRGAAEAEALEHWDVPFWAERLREARYAYREEELRPYFPLPSVLAGLFGLASRLFGVEVVPADGEAPVWHPDVRFFRVREGGGREIAAFYLDPYSRPAEKRGGAWMDDCVGRGRIRTELGTEIRLPVAHMVCNQTPPIADQPSLMSFDEIETLFHEFGHALQHMLTRVDHGLVAGIRNIEWDAVELPSQFMENWCYDRATLVGLSSHVDDGRPLPDSLFEKIRAARTYRAGTRMLRGIHLALVDLELHGAEVIQHADDAFRLQRRVAETTTVLPPLAEDRFLCAFEHIFAGGYAAGYYSYMWAEVLSADAFAAFEELGLENEGALRERGRRYRDTILACGGSRHPMEVFRAFRGRDPTTKALLRHAGLIE